MKTSFPKLPDYEFAWRSIQVEPIPLSGERITIGAVVKGSDQALIAAKLVPTPKLKKIYGQEFGSRIADALTLCLSSAEGFYQNKSLFSEWASPLEGFYLSKAYSSLASNIEEALLDAAKQCSSFSVSMELEKANELAGPSISAPESWRKGILEAVKVQRIDFVDCFDRKIPIRGAGVPMAFGFISANYAAQFDAISDSRGIQQGLVRVQSKLWQLDRLRDEATLFKPESCELLLRAPLNSGDHDEEVLLKEFVEELTYEASRRELDIYTTKSPVDAAKHIIEKAA